MPRCEAELARGGGGKPQIRRPRARRFGREDKQVFLDALAETCNITASAKVCGFSPSTIDCHRKKDATFRAGMLAALTSGYERLERALIERALHGVEEDVWHGGKKVGTKTVYNDAMALRLLSLHRDNVKGAPGETDEDLDEAYEAARTELEARLDEMRERLGYED